MTLVKLDLDRNGNRVADKHDKTLIIDADTIAFAACVVCEFEVDDGEWDISIPEAVSHCQDKLEFILDQVGGREENVRLHFTGGKSSFRYPLLLEAFPDIPEMQYKFKRRKKHVPQGLSEVKEELSKLYIATTHHEWEADDQVVFDKMQDPEAILIAVDKDVIGNTPGKHFNYYESRKHDIAMRWVEVSEEEAVYNQYVQAITGDRSDNIPGIKGMGPAKAAKYLVEGMDEDEMYEGLVSAYRENHKRDDISAEDMMQLNIRLVNMHQLTEKGIELWSVTR